MANIKRMATDPKTGERTAILASTSDGRKVWLRTLEYDQDVLRAKEISARKNYVRRQLERVLEIVGEDTYIDAAEGETETFFNAGGA